MPWMKCEQTNVGRSLSIFALTILTFVVSVGIIVYLSGEYSLDSMSTVLITVAVLLIELTVFRFLDETYENELYGRNKD